MGTPNETLESFLKENKDHHYNFEEEVTYKVSSGSLKFDYELNGGFGPGLHRFTGINEGGKTSEALEVMKNFLKMINFVIVVGALKDCCHSLKSHTCIN